jgi:hypothetical protein
MDRGPQEPIPLMEDPIQVDLLKPPFLKYSWPVVK